MSLLLKFKNKIINFSHFISNNSYLNSKNMRKHIFNKKVIVYTLAYGEFLDYFFNYTLPSLAHKSNTGALIQKGYEVEFLLYTIDKKSDVIKKYESHPFYNIYKINIVEFEYYGAQSNREIASYSIKEALRRCLDENAILYMAPPDLIVGNSSLFNSVDVSFGKNMCFASAHPRVSFEILNSIEKNTSQGLENSQLVALSIKFPHDNFKFANEDLESNTSHKGMSYRNISSNLYAITHSMPSTYVVFPIEEDFNYFSECLDFNMWDRGWLEILIKTNRVKISGSSDMFFAAELTSEVSNFNEQLKDNQKYNDLAGSSFNNRVCMTFTSVWRQTHD
jgi:hypothetical protein